MNRNSNAYTVIYAVVLTVLVAVLLSVAALSLADKQKANTDNEKKQQILMSVASKLDEPVTFENAGEVWAKLDMDSNKYFVNAQGEKVEEGDPFQVASKTLFQAGEIKADALLPMYVANINNTPYYIISMYGAGLWGPIWGYIAVDAEGNVAGASFDHDSETSGLGAKIKDDPNFAASFVGKNIYTNGEFTSVAVVKQGKQSPYGGEQVDAITGATKTSDCVSVMVYNSLKGYLPYLQTLGWCQTEEVSSCCPADSCTMDVCPMDSCKMDSCKDCPDKGQCPKGGQCPNCPKAE